MRPSPRAIARTALLLVIAGSPLCLTGCETTRDAYANVFLTGTVLTYEQYLSIDHNADPPLSAETVIDMLGKPREVRDVDGVKRMVSFWSYSFTGDLKRAEFHFDSMGKLMKKELW